MELGESAPPRIKQRTRGYQGEMNGCGRLGERVYLRVLFTAKGFFSLTYKTISFR